MHQDRMQILCDPGLGEETIGSDCLVGVRVPLGLMKMVWNLMKVVAV